MADTDILLTIGLDTKDAYKEAKHLQKEVEDIFENRKGIQSSTLASIEIQMKKILDQSNKIRSSMKEMLDVHADYTGLTSQFSTLANKAEELEMKLESMGGEDAEATAKFEEELDQIYNDMAQLIPKMQELEQVQVPTEEFAKLQEEYNRLNTAIEKGDGNYNELIDELDRVTDKMNRMRQAGTAMVSPEALDNFKEYESKLGTFNDKMKQLVVRYTEARSKLEAKLNPPSEELDEFNEELEESNEELGEVGKTGSKATSRLAGVMGLLKKAVDKVKSGMKKLLGHLVGIGKRASGPNNPFKSLLKTLVRFGLGISTLFVLFNKLRAGIKEGFSNLYKDNKKFKQSVDELKGALTTFKNSLAAAFQPIVSMAIPYIQKLVEYMTQLMQQVAKFSAAITGQKYYMQAIKQTGNAAEKAQKQLAGFDKLNVLNQQDGQGTMFKEVPLENAEELLRTLKDMFSLEGLYNMGKTFAQKINEFLENIQWDKIKQKAAEVGKKLATFLNGWIDNLHWENIGSTIAEGINTIFNFLYDFISTLHWGEIGKGIADAIMSFFETTDFDKIAETIAGFINGLSELVAKFISYTDFKKIGTKIGEFLNKTIKRINWSQLGENLKNLIIGLADIVISLMKAVDWEDVGNKIGEFLKEFFEGDPNPLGKVAEALWTALISAVKLVIGIGGENPLAAVIIGGLLTAKTISLFTALGNTLGITIGGGIAGGAAVAGPGIIGAIAGSLGGAQGLALASSITSALGPVLIAAIGGLAIGTILNDWLFEPANEELANWDPLGIIDDKYTVEGKAKAAEWAEDMAEEAAEGWNNGLKDAAEELDWTWLTDVMDIEGHDTEWDELVDSIYDGIHKIQAAGIDLADTEEVIEYLANPLKSGISSDTAQYIQLLSEGWDDVSQSTKNALLGVKEASETQQRALSASEEAAKQYAQTMSDTYVDTLNGMVDSTAEETNAMTNLYTSFKDNLKTIFNSIIKGSEGMSNGVSDGINFISETLNGFSFDIPDWVPGVGGKSLKFNLPKIGKIFIPQLAQGAVIPANKEFLAVLGDQKQGTNIEAPLDTIKQAVAEVLTQMGTSTEDNADIVINIDGDEIFRVIRKQDRIFKKSTGRSAFA